MDETHWHSLYGTAVRVRRVGTRIEFAVESPAIFRIEAQGSRWVVLDEAHQSPRQPGVKGYPPEFYKQVAEAYLELREQFPEAPAKMLARRYDRTAATVQRWLGKCEQMGLLTRERH